MKKKTIIINPDEGILEQLTEGLSESDKKECELLYQALWAEAGGFYEEAEELRKRANVCHGESKKGDE